ncbi:hypothetical protein GK047_03130 [Paenibacillus sp. SYP-B3998]|uniref:CBM-cenC domain-containing protein n=1 Tax=Paenibacillus sp. SYP-B3998 TaxID=2678564 RepID=A0A6G3ZS97_9BACL|nr:hypothetical protein [Paenibacillus sp. SYP-B3998]NEW05012.1 hypothetical protein [Paenibacillus sp. SYP-B3998]
MMLQPKTIQKVLIFVVMLSLLFQGISYAAADYPHGKVPIKDIYPTQQSVMDNLTIQKDKLLVGQQPDGNFEDFPHNTNVVANWNFENGTSTPTGWLSQTYAGSPTYAYVTNDSANAQAGKRLIQISSSSAASQGAWKTSLTGILPGQNYYFSTYYKTNNLASTDRGVTARISFLDAANNSVAASVYFDGKPGTQDWIELKGDVEIPALAANLDHVDIELLLWNATGTVSFDAARLMNRKIAANKEGAKETGFENVTIDTTNNYAAPWRLVTSAGSPNVSIDASQAKLGAKSAKITASSAATASWTQDVHLTKKTFNISTWYKTSNIVSSDKGVAIGIRFKDANNGDTAPEVFLNGSTGTKDWTRLAGQFTVPNVTAQDHVEISLYLYNATGTVWFDELQVEYANVLINGSFEASASGTAPDSWTYSAPEGSPKPTKLYEVSGANANSGAYSVGINSTSTTGRAYWYQPYTGTYREGDGRVFKAKYKTSAVFNSDATQTSSGVTLRVNFLKTDGTNAGNSVIVTAPPSTTWQEISTVFSVPTGTVKIEANLGLWYAEGTVWFDDAELVAPRQGGDMTDNTIGGAALLTYWWNQNGKSDADVQKAAQKAIDFYINKRTYTIDNPDTTYLRTLNSGGYYNRFYIDGESDAIGDYPTTAWALNSIGQILKYGAESGQPQLLTAQQKTTLEAIARSLWRWLTRTSIYNPQNADNQAIGTVVGGLTLGKVLNDTALQNEAIAYYNTGVAGTNNPVNDPGNGGAFGGVRNDRIAVNGHMIFDEKEKFDAHYGFYALSFLSDLYLLVNDKTSNFYLDGVEMAKYIDERLSENGWLYFGSRHDESDGDEGNITFYGNNVFSHETGYDLGRLLAVRVNFADSSYTPEVIGHRAHSNIEMHDHFKSWSGSKPSFNNEYSLSKNNVSVYFNKAGANLATPQAISVQGTAFTEGAVAGSRGEGLYYKDTNNAWNFLVNSSSGTNKYVSTTNYQVRKVDKTNSALSNTRNEYWVTNGDTLYNIMAVKFNANVSVKALNHLVGMPYMSSMNRIMNVSNGTAVLDLAQNSGSISGTQLTMDSLKLNGWPNLVMENNTDASNFGFNVLGNYYKTIEKLRENPDEGSKANFTWGNIKNTDRLNVNVIDSASNVSYASGEWVVMVLKYSASGSAEGFTVTPTYTNASTKALSNLIVEDNKMKFSLTWPNVTFTDKASSETISY